MQTSDPRLLFPTQATVAMQVSEPRLSSKHSQHPLQERASLLSCVRLLDAKDFLKLASPLPRSQDLPAEYFGTPSSPVDQVVSVSHAWRNQAYPDPTGQKSRLLAQLLPQIIAGNSEQSLYLFFDFISVPQRPFLPGQPDRTVEEVDVFENALHCMHEVYFYSDRIIHLPWEEVEVPGEGVEETLPARELLGAEFAQIGTRVQIASHSQQGALPQEPSMGGDSKGAADLFDGRSKGTANLFDQVVSVDGQMVDSSTQLASFLAGNPQLATVRHYPFGNYSMIPADARGWVFLERFITMVKCAMMDEDTAKHVVVTPSDSIFQQIMHGAHLLREASLLESAAQKRHQGELKRVLQSFQDELRSKQFSPASTDKRQMTGTSSKIDEDRSVVSKIMQDFVEHLSAHWEAEAAKQRRLGNRLKAALSTANTYLVEWECFSEDYAAMLSAASATTPWHLALVILMPPAVAVLPLLWAYPSPDDGWVSQGKFWVLSAPVVVFAASIYFPVAVAKFANIAYSRTMLLLHVAWAFTSTAMMIAVGIAVSAVWQVFPVPLSLFLGTGIVGAFVPALWWSVPQQQRASRQFRVRLATSMIGIVVMLSIHGVAIPLINSSIPLLSEGWQLMLVSCYLLLKLAVEFFGLKLSKVLGADTMTYFVYIATFLYEVNLCVAFSKVNSWFLVAEHVGFDVLENAYHLYSLLHQDHSEHGGARRQQYILASLMLREFVEVLVPGFFLAMHELIRVLRPENFALFCGRSEQDVRRTVYFLLVAITVELIGSCVTCGVLQFWGHKPLRLLRGVLATRFDFFAVLACSALTYYGSLQHSHYGMDLSFRFLWVAEPDSAVWQCGLTWDILSLDVAS